MNCQAEELQQIYSRLGQISRRPQAFGLGPSVPPPLAEVLETILRALRRAMEERETTEEDLAAELSQDADQIVSASDWQPQANRLRIADPYALKTQVEVCGQL